MKLLRELLESRYYQGPVDSVPNPTLQDMRKHLPKGYRDMYKSDDMQEYLDQQWETFRALAANPNRTREESLTLNSYLEILGNYLKKHGINKDRVPVGS